MRSRPHLTKIALVAASLAFLVTSCGSSSGSDASSDTTAKKTTTTAADKTTTTEAAPDGPTSDELEALLPQAGPLGTGWAIDSSEKDTSDEGDKAIAEQCPGAAALTQDDGDNEDRVTRAFENTDGRQLEVSLSPSAEAVSASDLNDLIDAINSCDAITVEDAQNGTSTSFKFHAEEDTDYGDQGVRLQAVVTISSDQLDQPVELNLYGLSFRNGTVGVRVSAFDGLNEETLAVVPADTDQLVELAGNLDTETKDLAN